MSCCWPWPPGDFSRLPTGFLPIEDQGYFVISAQLPDAASQERTEEVIDKLNQVVGATPGVENVNAIDGQNVFDGTVSSNAAACYVTFKDWNAAKNRGRKSGGRSDAFAESISPRFPARESSPFRRRRFAAWASSGGFQMEVEDIGNVGLNELGQVDQRNGRRRQRPNQPAGLNTTFSASVPQLYLDIDRSKVKSLESSAEPGFQHAAILLGIDVRQPFNQFGRTYQVLIQADANFRDRIRRHHEVAGAQQRREAWFRSARC